MIDKLELRIPGSAAFSRKFSQLYQEVRNDPKVDPFHPSKHYLAVGDLRPFGYDAILHMCCVHGKESRHKVELVDVGEMGYGRMVAEVEQLFDLDALGLPITRADYCADVRGVQVSWFQTHLHVRFKRFVCDIGETTCEPFVRMGKNNVQTVYFGKRPNCFRIYDKHAELLQQYAKMTRKASDVAELPTFESLYRLPQHGVILTRIERQAGGGRVPAAVGTLSKLKESGPEFNPFDGLDFLVNAGQEPQVKDWGLQRYGFGCWLRLQIEDIGLHRTRSLLNQHSTNNAAKILREFSPFVPVGGGVTAPTPI